jgi:hypothetical protein
VDSNEGEIVQALLDKKVELNLREQVVRRD